VTTVKWLTHKESPTVATTDPATLRDNLAAIKARVKTKSYSCIVSALNKMGEAAVRLHLTPLRAYTDEEIMQLGEGATEGMAATTKCNILSHLARLIDVRFRWLKPKPVPLVVRRPLSEDEIYRLLHQCKPHWKAPIMVGLLCGLRIGDVTDLRWSGVTSDTITVRQQKTGVIVRIPIHPDLKKEIDKIPRPMDGTALVFPELTDDHKGGKVCRTEVQYRFRCEAILPAGMAGITFHYLRYTFVSRLYESGCSLPAALALAGHCNTLIHLTYAKPSAKGLLDAIKNMPGITHKQIVEMIDERTSK